MKRILCLLLALVLAFSLVACGGQKPSDKDTDTDGNKTDNGDKNNTSLMEGTPAGGTEGYPTVPVQGDVVKLCATADAPDRQKEALKKIYGLDIEATTVHYNDYTTKFATLVLSGDSPDVGFYRRDQADFPRYIVNNLVDDLNQYVDLSDSFYDPVRDLLDATVYQGGNYMMPYGFGTAQAVFYNTRLFTEAGLDTPWDLYQKDEWTLDKLQEYAIELTEKGDDGVPTRYGFAFVRPFGIFYTEGKSLGSFDAKTGAVVNNIKDPAFARAMGYLSSWVNEYKCAPNDCEQTVNWLVNGKVAMVFCEAWFGHESMVSLAKDGTLGIAPMARDAKCDGYYGRGEMRSWWLPKGAKNPGGGIAYWNICVKDFEQGGYTDAYYETCQKSGYSEENMEQVRTCLDPEKVKPVLELTPWLTGGADWYTILRSSTWEVELSKVETKIQASIDSLFKPLEEDLPISPKPVDDFNAYTEESPASKIYVTNAQGSQNVTISTTADNAQGGSGSALQYTYDVSDVGWGGISRNYGKTWENNDAIRFWVKGDGSKQTLKWQVTFINGASFTYLYTLEGDEGKVVTVKFKDFTPSEMFTADDWMSEQVQTVGLFVETAGKHTFWIDNLEAVNTEK